MNLSQAEFVEQCLIKYRYEPLPEGIKWHTAHFPTPECLGGTETIKLWESDHAVQAIIQCEEYDYPCLYGWEKKYLPPELLSRFEHWMFQKGHAVSTWVKENTTYEERCLKAKAQYEALESEKRRRWHVNGQKALSKDVLSKGGRNSHLNRDQDSYREAALKSTAKRLQDNPSYFSDMGKRARANEPREVKSARGHAIPPEARKRGSDKANSQKWVCLVTGHITTAGPLTLWQKARGIDTFLRRKLND